MLRPATLESMARGGPALCATGLLLSDQGSTVKGISELRGNVDKVVEGLACSPGGINVLADSPILPGTSRKATGAFTHFRDAKMT